MQLYSFDLEPPRPRRYTSFALALGIMLAWPHLGVSELMPAKPKDRRAGVWAVQWQPAKLVNGSPVVFQVAPPVRMTGLSGKWLEHDVFFTYDAGSKSWYGIAGISLQTRPGIYPLELKGTPARGSEISFVRKFAIRPGLYPSITATVAKRYTEPSPEQLERIRQDKTIKQDVFRQTDPRREWQGKFRPPVNARVSDIFGTRRTFNGKVQSMHEGLDYAVPQGTTVSAANAGTVLLASPLYFEGNCVVLDHGQGLLTLYLHLSEIKVKTGERVEPGQEIGLSGGTGRATGPHLHMAVRWEGVYLNPATLLTLKLP
jgi:murein DD-endopeptidase MepM/ murein hydrolase activator NlpD